jgi:Primase C terminal 1 (PriCT-1)
MYGATVALPSSRQVHPSGKRYAWSVDSGTEIAAAPDWLLDRAIGHNGNGKCATAASEWREIVAKGVTEGRRDCTAARLAGHLLRRDIDAIVALELLHCWNTARCVPPLPTTDIERIVESIAAKELRRRVGG